jgi:glycosyltransferase involved in cell wall biosynthesis
VSEAFGVSLFAVPKAFTGHIGIIQRNAIESWVRLDRVREVLLLGDDAGVEDAARAVGASHIPRVSTDEDGVPLLDAIFEMAADAATSDWLCYVNADILLLPPFIEAVSLAAATVGDALIVSRRWNLEVQHPLMFTEDWAAHLRDRVIRDGTLFTPFGIDVFAFPRSLFGVLPAFSIGRFSWDNWLVHEARRLGFPVVDATDATAVIHQEHAYDQDKSSGLMRRTPAALRNFWLAGDSVHGLYSVSDATHRLESGEIVKHPTRTVSVVLVRTGGLEQLRECLRGLSSQSHPRSYIEIIVVEPSEQRFTATVLAEFPFVKYTREEQPGRAAARNKGAALASGELIAFLDSESRVSGGWVEEAHAAAERCAFDCLVTSSVEEQDSRVTAHRRYAAATFERRKSYIDGSPAFFVDGMVVPQAVWQQVGPFNEVLGDRACIDWDWLTRAFRSGFGISHAATAIVTLPGPTSWRELQAQGRRTVRAEVRLTRMRRDPRFLTLGAFLAAYGRLALHEIRAALTDQGVAPTGRLQIMWLAIRVWWLRWREAWKEFSIP